ncbi:unnamed protein product [Pipistrellus nathusii]|uniref:Uncharacterized protein n=1 Tax=Pipistrellus nathusii TaxID=59473 RepID=A0ABN9ZKT0_PIPNA
MAGPQVRAAGTQKAGTAPRVQGERSGMGDTVTVTCLAICPGGESRGPAVLVLLAPRVPLRWAWVLTSGPSSLTQRWQPRLPVSRAPGTSHLASQGEALAALPPPSGQSQGPPPYFYFLLKMLTL